MQGGGNWGPPQGGPPPGYPPQQYPPQQQQYPQQHQHQHPPQQQQQWGAPPPGGYGAPMHHGQPYPQPFGYQQQPFAGGPGPNGWTTCPRCQSPNIYRASFTWWGGIVGPALFKHTVCRGCSFGFNWKTGKSNGTAIAIYFGVIFAICIVGTIVSAAAH